MPARLYKGPSLDDLLAHIRKEHGKGAKIVAAKKSRQGGVGGFFSHEVYEVTVEISSKKTAEKRVKDNNREAAKIEISPQTVSILEVAEAINEKESTLDVEVVGGSFQSRLKEMHANNSGTATNTAVLDGVQAAQEFADQLKALREMNDKQIAQPSSDGPTVDVQPEHELPEDPFVGDELLPVAFVPDEKIVQEELELVSDATEVTGWHPVIVDETEAVEEAGPDPVAQPDPVKEELDSVKQQLHDLKQEVAKQELQAVRQQLESAKQQLDVAKQEFELQTLQAALKAEQEAADAAATAAAIEFETLLAEEDEEIEVIEIDAANNDEEAEQAEENEETPEVKAPTYVPDAELTRRMEQVSSTISSDLLSEYQDGLASRGVPRVLLSNLNEKENISVQLEEIFSEIPGISNADISHSRTIAVVGPLADVTEMTKILAQRVETTTQNIYMASNTNGKQTTRTINNADDARAVKRGWKRRPTATIVGIPLDELGYETIWAEEILTAIEPEFTLMIADARNKVEDIESAVESLTGVDALAINNLNATTSPAAIMQLGIPIAYIDDRIATPGLWAARLTEGLLA